MATEELRQNFHRLIDTIADEKSLVELYSVAELYIEQQNVLLDGVTQAHGNFVTASRTGRILYKRPDTKRGKAVAR